MYSYSMNIEELERDHKKLMETVETIKDVYLADDIFDNDFIHNKVNRFIWKQNKLYEKSKRTIFYEERRRLNNLKKLDKQIR
jgi:hypothetical protein